MHSVVHPLTWAVTIDVNVPAISYIECDREGVSLLHDNIPDPKRTAGQAMDFLEYILNKS